MVVNVIKATGEKEPFSEDKLKISIQRAGISKDLESQVIEHVRSKLYENIQTSEIYRHIMEFLEKAPLYEKAKYSLKQAIMDLGPTGYPFEDFVAEILKKEGFTTKTRSLLSGACVNHEIDVIAQKQNERVMVEAKFHNEAGTRTEVHVALYTKARFDDVKNKYNLSQAWIVTNTKVTSDALAYALCANVKIISWSYPEKEGLRDLIEKFNLHPMTVLTTLSNNQKQQLLENHVVLCREILEQPSALNLIDIPEDRKKEVLEEIKAVCGSKFQ
ncbi:MAG: restriction endonuclease [Patescibacteria group bacterium]|nr:restriction endonuclease [Patescibacteria group bacterium]